MTQQDMSGETEFSAASFDAEQPAAFYLADNREGLESLSDATLLVADVELPVHSQVGRLPAGGVSVSYGTVAGGQPGAAAQCQAVVASPTATEPRPLPAPWACCRC